MNYNKVSRYYFIVILYMQFMHNIKANNLNVTDVSLIGSVCTSMLFSDMIIENYSRGMVEIFILCRQLELMLSENSIDVHTGH